MFKPQSLSCGRDHSGGDDLLTCLVVEDDAFSRLAVMRAVHKAGLPLHLDFAPSLSEAREKLMSNFYDLLLVDHHLPDGFGADFVLEMAASGIAHWGRVSILTGLREHAEAELRGRLRSLIIMDKADFGPAALADFVYAYPEAS